MLCSQLTTRILLIHIGPIRDANQRIMGLIHRRLREIHVVGRDQGQALGICHFDKSALCQTLCFREATVFGMALKLHIQAIPKCAMQTIHQRLSRRALTAL